MYASSHLLSCLLELIILQKSKKRTYNTRNSISEQRDRNKRIATRTRRGRLPSSEEVNEGMIEEGVVDEVEEMYRNF